MSFPTTFFEILLVEAAAAGTDLGEDGVVGEAALLNRVETFKGFGDCVKAEGILRGGGREGILAELVADDDDNIALPPVRGFRDVGAALVVVVVVVPVEGSAVPMCVGGASEVIITVPGAELLLTIGLGVSSEVTERTSALLE